MARVRKPRIPNLRRDIIFSAKPVRDFPGLGMEELNRQFKRIPKVSSSFRGESSLLTYGRTGQKPTVPSELRQQGIKTTFKLPFDVDFEQAPLRRKGKPFDIEDEPNIPSVQPRSQRKSKPFDPEDEPNMVSARRNVRSTSRTAPSRVRRRTIFEGLIPDDFLNAKSTQVSAPSRTARNGVRRRTIQDVFSGDDALRDMVRGTQYEGLVPAKSQPSPRPTSAPVPPLIRGGRSSAIDAIYENINNNRLNDIIFAKNPEVSPSPYNKTPSTKKPNASGGYDTGRSYNVKTQDELLNYLRQTDSKAYRELTERIRASKRDPRDTGVSYDVPTFNQRIKYLIRTGDIKGAKDLQRQMRLGIRDVSNTGTIDNLRNDIARQGDLQVQPRQIDIEDEINRTMSGKTVPSRFPDEDIMSGSLPDFSNENWKYLSNAYKKPNGSWEQYNWLEPNSTIIQQALSSLPRRTPVSRSATSSAPMTERERRALRRAEMRASYDVMPQESMSGVYRGRTAKKNMKKGSLKKADYFINNAPSRYSPEEVKATMGEVGRRGTFGRQNAQLQDAKDWIAISQALSEIAKSPYYMTQREVSGNAKSSRYRNTMSQEPARISVADKKLYEQLKGKVKPRSSKGSSAIKSMSKRQTGPKPDKYF